MVFALDAYSFDTAKAAMSYYLLNQGDHPRRPLKKHKTQITAISNLKSAI
jgi:hypothetical protein